MLPGEIVIQLDAKAKSLQEASPGSIVTRSDVARRAIYSFLKE